MALFLIDQFKTSDYFAMLAEVYPELARSTPGEHASADFPRLRWVVSLRGNTPAELAALERRRSFDRFVASLVRQAEAEGDITAGMNPTITAHLLFGLVNSLVEWYRPGKRVSDEAVADAVCQFAFHGIRAT